MRQQQRRIEDAIVRTIRILYSCRMAMVLAWATFVVTGSYAQGTAFSYQGQLLNNGQPANGNYDITFTLFAYSQYGFPAAPVLTNLDTPVSGGLFFATLDFGSAFSGSNYWLEIAVRTNGNGSFTILEPRQPLTPVPYAVFSAYASNAVTALTANTATSANSVPAGGIVGTISVSNLSSSVALLTANGTLPTNVLPTNLTSPSGIVWQSPSATTIQAQPNTGYVLTNSQQVTITLPVVPNIGDIIEITGAGLGGWILAQNPGQTIAASFTPLSLPGDAIGNWVSIASSSDGTKLAAASQAINSGGGIWTSANSGTTWLQTGAPGGYWYSITSSSDGTKLAAVNPQPETNGNSYAGGIFTSSNSGTNWTLVSAMPTGFNGEPLSITSSADGTKLALAIANQGIYTSTNSGTNFSKTSAPTNVYWASIASSSDGTKLAAVNNGGGQGGAIWVSSNSGTNWAQCSDLPLADWQSIASSSNGTILVAATPVVYIGDDQYPGGIWLSSNAGATWTQTTAPSVYWTSVASSSDGTILAATANFFIGDDTAGIWTSTNSGTNWLQLNAPALDWDLTFRSSPWTCIASSSDGTKLVAAASTYSPPPGSEIWTVDNGIVSNESESISGSTIVGTGRFLQGTFGAVVKLVYSGGGQFIALYQNGSFSGH